MAKPGKPKFQYPEGVQAEISAHCMNCRHFKRPDRMFVDSALSGSIPDAVTVQNVRKFVTVGYCKTKGLSTSFFATCQSFKLNGPDQENAEDK